MPLLQHGGQSSAAIPKASLPQKPVARGPQQAGAVAPNQKAEIGKQSRVPETGGAKSKAPLLIGLGVAAAIAVGAFMRFGGEKSDVARLSKVESAAPPTAKPPTLESRATPGAAPKPAPVVVSSAPRPETPKPAPEKKADPKPVVAAPTATKAPAPAVPSSSPAFTPGQWVKVFTKFEDLPEDLRKPDSGVKFEDGWIRVGGKRAYAGLPDSLRGNYGVRATFSFMEGKNAGSAINLRRVAKDKTQLIS